MLLLLLCKYTKLTFRRIVNYHVITDNLQWFCFFNFSNILFSSCVTRRPPFAIDHPNNIASSFLTGYFWCTTRSAYHKCRQAGRTSMDGVFWLTRTDFAKCGRRTYGCVRTDCRRPNRRILALLRTMIAGYQRHNLPVYFMLYNLLFGSSYGKSQYFVV